MYGRRERPRVPAYGPAAGAVKRARGALGMSQRALGSLLGVSALTVSRWETTRAEVPTRQRKALVERLVPKSPAIAAEVAKGLGVTVSAELEHQGDAAKRKELLQVALLRTAEELDVIPSLVLRTAKDLLKRLHRAKMTPAEALKHLEVEL